MFGCPIDSEIISNTNQAQMLWYASMFNNERKNTFDADLNMTEYLASFINHEAVRQTRESRENKKVVSDIDFDQIVRNRFGRDLSPEALAAGSRAATVDEGKKVAPSDKRGSLNIAETIRKYAGLELDDIKWKPNK